MAHCVIIVGRIILFRIDDHHAHIRGNGRSISLVIDDYHHLIVHSHLQIPPSSPSVCCLGSYFYAGKLHTSFGSAAQHAEFKSAIAVDIQFLIQDGLIYKVMKPIRLSDAAKCDIH